MYLSLHPLCAACQRHDRTVAASVVDHIKPHKGNRELFWDEHNWQGLCKPCHDVKTAREDGGFGNSKPVGRSNPCNLAARDRALNQIFARAK
ncbi:HNH endonuclease [Halothiobacillus sp.]|uniref:HNH endonuclease signature motif containing protein n=1 Tax=Halothiobacillus sp. TaxID=1891311 RepID=UPI00345454C3